MIGTLDVIPKSIAPAALAYLIVCYGLGDRFAERLAVNVHIPACIEGETAKAARADYGADLQKEIARKLFEEVFKSVPGMKDLPGMQTIEKLSSQKTRGSNTSMLAAKCVCLADAARTETKLDYMAWVASIRLHQPQGVSNFPGVMARLDRRGVCGKEGRS